MEEKNNITLNKETVDILVANIIPTTKYFETRFDYMQHQINEIKENMDEFKKDVDRRFTEVKEEINDFKKDVDRRFTEVKEEINDFKKDVDRRFEEIDKRFEQVDKRFEQVDKRFEQVENKLEQMNNNINLLTLKIEELARKQETTIRDYIIERDRYYDKKFTNLRNFNIAIISLIAGIILKFFGIIHIGG